MTEEDFRKLFPELTDEEITIAAQPGRLIVSLRGQRRAPNVFALKLVNQQRGSNTLVLTETAARQLARILTQSGF